MTERSIGKPIMSGYHEQPPNSRRVLELLLRNSPGKAVPQSQGEPFSTWFSCPFSARYMDIWVITHSGMHDRNSKHESAPFKR